ncbi:TonB-dependent vitamin B12 receptor [Luteimonas sp. BDR2-5]|uniref:TonB-dependent vitamin B12 receptor n=1 Tax=Proluteimonas luteida TaxID=2878685 RepID=UPI001E4E9707|nr:TonB-dependent vitamin B12 receptor [Luteimonas sp. BDR2-5]MCD9028439.1 TonB-dependent vitamin B12 receptor [Luteimonas sp. BDR2-5]
MLLRSLTAALAAALAAPVATAADTADAGDLDTVLVTATRTEGTLRDTLVPAQVIDRAEIERSQARDLPELLRGRAGLDVGNQGGPGKLSTVSIRGTEADHVLVLVDGIRIGSATAGLAAFQDLPVEQIERIEIVRGPRSSLYGSEAIGGVIQIFTRRDHGAWTPRFRAGAGSHGLREASAGIGGGIGSGWFGADVAYRRTDGIDACRGTAAGWGAGCFVDEPDRDGYRNRSANLRAGATLAEGLVIEGHLLHAEAENRFDGSVFGGNEADNVQQVVGGKLAWTAAERITVTAQAGRARDKSDNYFSDGSAPRLAAGSFDTTRDSASLQADFGIADGHVLSTGYDWQKDLVDSDTGYDATSRRNIGVFAGYTGRLGAHRLQASVRNDDNAQFGGHSTGSLGWGMQLGHGLRLTASAATGFKAPTFNDLYYPFFGNPDLRPEESASYNLGISQAGAGWRWTLDVYRTDVDDLISYDAAIGLPNNVDEARIRGAEATVSTSLTGFDLNLQLSHVDPRNRSAGGNFDNLLARRARNSGRIDLDRAFGAFRAGITLNGAGHRYDDAANSVRVGGYATTDLRLAYAVHADWTLEARATNVLDRDYETVAWYYQPGREYGLALRWQPAGR